MDITAIVGARVLYVIQRKDDMGIWRDGSGSESEDIAIGNKAYIARTEGRGRGLRLIKRVTFETLVSET